MRNLKKILALVLALVMSMSVMSISNAAFTDAKDVTGTYNEAVTVLAGMGVFQGRDDGSFDPQGKITRAEVAAIIYRVVTGDVSDAQVGIYADYNKFDDVKSTAWYAGYVNYCANAEYIKGYDAKTFGPNDPVTGYQALAMILRAVGYDKMGEFTGSGWQVQTAAYGQQLGITTNITAGTLGVAATREVVAEILFNTVAYVPTVTYTMLTGYNQYTTINGTVLNSTLGEMAPFYLDSEAHTDMWKRPATRWFNDVTNGTYGIIAKAAKAKFSTAVSECEVAAAIGVSTTKTLPLYVNGQLVGNYTINAVDTVTKMGAQGRIFEVYSDRIVMVDTFLAEVNYVLKAAYDAKGHLTRPATISLQVFDGTVGGTELILTNGKVDYTYSQFDMVLVHAYTAAGNDVNLSGALYPATNSNSAGEIYGLAEVLTPGTQTLIWTTVNMHTVNGTDYNDAEEFHLDEAGFETTAHSWYFDQFGNLIGATDIATQYSYGVIKALWWAGDATNGAGVAKASVVYMDGTTEVVTLGSVRINDEAITVNNKYVPAYSVVNTDIMQVVAGTGTYAGKLWVATNAATNAGNDTNGIILDNLFRFNVDANGYVHAVEVDDTNGNVSMKNTDGTTGIVNGIPTNTDVIVNANTVFMIKNANNTITTVTGFANIGSYAAGEIDYVKGANGFAKYVYITASKLSAVSVSIFVPTTQQYTYDPATGVYTMFGYVDGVLGELKTYDDPAVAFAGARAVSILGTSNIKVNTPYIVKMVNGKAVLDNSASDTVYEVKSDSVVINTIMTSDGNTYSNNAYAGQSIAYVSGGYVAGDVYVANGNTYNITGVTPVVGEWTPSMAGKNVVLVTYTAYGNQLVTAAYIFNAAPGALVGARQVTGTVTHIAPTTATTVAAFKAGATIAAVHTGAGDDLATLMITNIRIQKLDANGIFVDWAGDMFVAGTYRVFTSYAISGITYDMTNGLREGVVLGASSDTQIITVL